MLQHGNSRNSIFSNCSENTVCSKQPPVDDSHLKTSPDNTSYLESYGYAPESWQSWVGSSNWQPLPGSRAQRPKFSLAVEGHSEVGKHTYYKVRCRIEGGQGLIVWHTSQRLFRIRDGLHTPVVAALSGKYQKIFSQAQFARHGGPPGTSDRLAKWLETLAETVNQGLAPPDLLGQIFRFLEAPQMGHGRDAELEFGRAASADSPKMGSSLSQMQPQTSLTLLRRKSIERKAFVQVLFYEELRKRFEFECAERCFSLQCRGADGKKLINEVLYCLLQNLDDLKVRLEARTCMWDTGTQTFVTLDDERRAQLERNLTEDLEPALFRALARAATAGNEYEQGPCGNSALANCRSVLEQDCIQLLQQKTAVAEECEDLEEEEFQLQRTLEKQGATDSEQESRDGEASTTSSMRGSWFASPTRVNSGDTVDTCTAPIVVKKAPQTRLQKLAEKKERKQEDGAKKTRLQKLLHQKRRTSKDESAEVASHRPVQQSGLPQAPAANWPAAPKNLETE